MDERKFVRFKHDELGVKEYIKHNLGKGRISEVTIEYTPVGEKIIVATDRPGVVIGSRGEKINELTQVLKKKFKLDNPHIDIKEITQPKLDAQLVADDIALQLEKKGSLRFKLIAYRYMEDIRRAGALGVEIVLSGKLPSERAKSWRFSQGYLKKTGDPARVVLRAMTQARTNLGVIGIKVSILPPTAAIHDRIVLTPELINQYRIDSNNPATFEEKKQVVVEKKKPKRSVKK